MHKLCSAKPARSGVAAITIATALMAGHAAAHADTTWHWQYSGAGVAASGTLLTKDTPDAAGFYKVLSITGSRDGDAITGLYPTGSAIPGNEPYAVDNLLRVEGTNGQITVHGLGFSLASGAHANPYFADFLATPGYMEVFTQGSAFSEVPVTFTATAVPEPATLALVLSGLGVMRLVASRRR